MATQWRVYGKDTVACKLSKADLPGFFRKQVVIGQNEVALIVKNGEVKDTVTESMETVSGLWSKFKGPFGANEDIDVFIVDKSPIDFTVFLGETERGAVSSEFSSTDSETERDNKKTEEKQSWLRKIIGKKPAKTKEHVYEAIESYSQARLDTSNVTLVALTIDHELISAECRFRVSVLPEDAKIFSGLLKGRTALATWDLATLARDELLAKVLLPRIAQHKAEELRGNRALFDQITADVKFELKGTCNLWGLTLEDFIINWGLTESEIQQIEEKRLEREEQAREFDHRRRLADMQRELEIEKTKVDNLQQLKLAEAQGDEDLKELFLATEISRDLMVEGKRVDVATVDADIRVIQLGVERQESNLRVETQKAEELLRLEIQDKEFKQRQEARLAEIDAEDKEMRSMVQAQIQMTTAKHDREMEARRLEIDSDFHKRQQDADNRYQDRKIRL